MINLKAKKKLESIVQGEIFSQEEFKKYYSVDASSYQITPDAIIIPKNEKDIINIIKIANKFKIPVTVRGAGTGLVGGVLNRGIIIDMKNFDLICENDKYVKVGGGVLKGNLDSKLDEKKRFFPPNPSIGPFCSIGGMLGNNSSGSKSLKYGSVIDNVFEVTFIDGVGNKITLPRDKKWAKKITKLTRQIDKSKFPKVTKNSSGYRIDKVKSQTDVHKILIGSEGTLGIITSAKLKIKHKPKERRLFIIEYSSVKKALKNCLEIKDTKPSALEFLDEFTLNKINFKFNDKTKCLLFVEYDDKKNKSHKEILNKINTGKIVKKLEKESEIIRWWRYRDSALHYSLKKISKQKMIPHIIEDAAVPLVDLPRIFTKLDKINREYKTKIIAYGHAGNGNIHIRLILDRKEKETVRDITKDYFETIIKMKGTITAEHGDGLARSEFVKKQYGKKNYSIFKEIKKMFDPYGILNPGKIITKKSTIIENLERF